MMNQLIDFCNQDFDISLKGVEPNLRQLKNKVILITGGTGFMGSWLSMLTIHLNERYSYNIKLFLVAPEFDNPLLESITSDIKYVHFIQQDVRNYFEIPEDVNYIIHAAASPDTRFHASQPIKTIESIVNGTSNVLKAASRLQDLHKFVHISSGLIYGKNETGIYNESSFGPLNCSQLTAVYSESKRLSETIAIAHKNQFRLPLTIVRPFTFIGAFQNLDKPWAFNSMLRDALLKQPLRILGNGEVKRGYMYGSDMATWLYNTLSNSKTGSIYNVGSDESISLKELATMIKNTLHHIEKVEIKENVMLQNNFHWVADTQLIQKELNVSQKFNIEMAVKRTIDFYTIFR
jgi:nucleoside-diphosphate-sugar epimerase